MAKKDVMIKDAPLVDALSGEEKIPISDGSGEPKSTNINGIKDFIGDSYELVELSEEVSKKQSTLVSGENIKTINGQSLLGEGDIQTNNDAPEVYGDTYFNTEISGTSVYLSANVAETLDEVTERGKLIDAYDAKQKFSANQADIESLKNDKVSKAEVANFVPIDRWESTNMEMMNSISLNDEAIAEQSGKLTELSEEIEHQSIFIEDLQNTKIDRENDDYYPKMAVGLADNLAGVDVVDSEINFRRSGGGAITDGVARIESIKGNSVVWNQMVLNNRKSGVVNGITITNNGDGSFTINGTATEESWLSMEAQDRKDIISGHKWAYLGCPSGGSTSTYLLWDGNGRIQDTGNGGIAIINDTFVTLRIVIRSGITCTNLVFKPRLIDLTQMFGAGNEPTTIEEFYARIPMGVDLNAYNEGEVIHMDVQSLESQGVNAWDEEWEIGEINFDDGEILDNKPNSIRCVNFQKAISGATYFRHNAQGKNTAVLFYDKDYNFISGSAGNNNSCVAPNNAAYFKTFTAYGSIYNHDICINLSDASINGKYFPYIKRVEDLSIIRKYFPQGMKSAGTAHDEIRYNKATQKWEYSKGRLRSVDLGSLTWNYYSSSNTSLFKAQFADIKIASSNDVANMLCAPYTANNANTWQGDKTIVATPLSGVQIWIHEEAYKDNLEAFKAAMQGVILYYESNDWEWVELDAEDQFKDLDYQVWNCGTEKAIAEGKSAPLAADITYGFNAIGKIKELESLVAALRAKVGI